MRFILSFLCLIILAAAANAETTENGSYDDLLELHSELQDHMEPGFTSAMVLDSRTRVGEVFDNDVMTDKLRGLDGFDRRLSAMSVRSWTLAEQVEFLAVKSLLNGHRFNLEVLRPWKRDPGFYLDPLMRVAFTDVTGTTAEMTQLQERLGIIPTMLAGARENLTEVAGDYAALALFNLENSDGVNHYHPYRDVPPAGIIGWYDDLLERSRTQRPEIVQQVVAARTALLGFRDWLRAERARMNAPAGVGAARYDWYIRHVRMIPLTSQEMIVLAEREHERMTAALAILRHRNRAQAQLELSASAEEQRRKISSTDQIVRDFLVREDIITIPDFVGDLGSNTPWINRSSGPNFWEQIQFRDPIPDHLHAVIPGHRFDAVIASRDERPIRGRFSDGGRAEGWATYLEETLMMAGATAHSPRADEYIQIFGVFRAARVPADIYMQHNVWDVSEAVSYMRQNTPWLDEDVARVDAEIYLRRPPGYGIAYTIGKLQMDALLADRSRQLGDDFSLRDFHDTFLKSGRLPIALIRYEMTGEDDEVSLFWDTEPIPPAS